jgi:beta-glucosidase
MGENQEITVSAEISNTGPVKGAEVVQLYIEPIDSSIDRPPRELKGFEKIFLEAGETKKISMILDQKSFQYFNGAKNRWIVENGAYKILLGSSSRDILLQGEFHIQS